MKFREEIISGNNQAELQTELRYIIAAAKADGLELIRLVPKPCDEERESSRIYACVTKVLRAVKKDGKIQLFISEPQIFEANTEGQYIRNKYFDFVKERTGEERTVYVLL